MTPNTTNRWNIVDAVHGGQMTVDLACLYRFQATTAGTNLYFIGDPQPLLVTNRYNTIPSLIREGVGDITQITDRLQGTSRQVA